MAVNLAIAHRNAGHTSLLYTIFEPGELGERAREAGIPLLSFHKRVGFSPEVLLRVARQLRADKAEVVHTHNSGIHHYGVAASRLAGVKAVINTRHGLAFHSGKRQEVYYRAVMPFTDAVVFVCRDGQRHFTQTGSVPPHKGSVILNGIPVERFQALRASPGAHMPKIRFGTIGRLVRAKAHGDLLAAFSRVARELPQAELHIWGHGELQADLLAGIAACGLGKQIQFHGTAVNAAAALQQMDVFVLSSISEGLPLVVLEAMAAGLPLVSTRIGGVPEVAPEGAAALFCRPGDPEGLADAMHRMAMSGLAAAGEAAYQYAGRNFSLETMQRQYQELFAAVIGRRPRKAAAACL